MLDISDVMFTISQQMLIAGITSIEVSKIMLASSQQIPGAGIQKLKPGIAAIDDS